MNKKKLLLLLTLPTVCLTAHPVSEKPQGKVNYPSNFQVEGGSNLFLFGDYLYWRANEDSLYYTHTGAGTGTVFPATGSIDFNGRLKKIDPEWGNGLRLGLGVNFPKEGYDLNAAWTWFATSDSHSVHASNGSLIVLWAHPDAPTSVHATTAKGHWDLDVNVLDLEWGRSSWFGGHLSMRPFFGLRGLWLDQTLKNHYDYATIQPTFGSVHSESNYRGGGLRAGGDVRFVLPYDFAIYGLASGSLLYGKFDADFHVKEDSTTIARTDDDFWDGISSLQVALGLGWDTHFHKDRLHIEFHLGWEQNIWFGANQMNHFMGQLHGGNYFQENSNLSLQGLVAGGRFDF
ncbi:MAG: hypothetical protein HYX67_06480 [Candidatus Melainabacteria bacterium]|nr:hypothetical protein [Candidatus Melainabacteria bacterium]